MTKALGLTPLARLAGLAPLAARAIAGAIMAAHGSQKLSAGPDLAAKCATYGRTDAGGRWR